MKHTPVKYAGCQLIVKNVRLSKKFYETVLQASAIIDLGDHIVFEQGFFLLQEESWLRLTGAGKEQLSYKHHTTQLYFEVDNLDNFLQDFAAYPGTQLLHPVKEHPWGQRSIRFYDPDGHVVEVAESMKVVALRCILSGMSVEQASEKTQFPIGFIEKWKRESE